MSQEIQQIEELNCGLKLQSENQKILLAHLEKLIVLLLYCLFHLLMFLIEGTDKSTRGCLENP